MACGRTRTTAAAADDTPRLGPGSSKHEILQIALSPLGAGEPPRVGISAVQRRPRLCKWGPPPKPLAAH
jgi:hypothetical protein